MYIYFLLSTLTPIVSSSHRLFLKQFPFSSLDGAGRLASFQLSDGVKTLSIPPSMIQRNLLRSSLTSIWCARPNIITSKYVSLCLLRCQYAVMWRIIFCGLKFHFYFLPSLVTDYNPSRPFDHAYIFNYSAPVVAPNPNIVVSLRYRNG